MKNLRESQKQVHLPNINNGKVNFETNPYSDITQIGKTRNQTLNKSIDYSSSKTALRHQRLVSSDQANSLDYNELKKGISGLFDIMQLDRPNFKRFKEMLHEEAFR